MKTKKEQFRMYEVDQDYINFLRGEDRFAYRLKNEVDKQVYSHYGVKKNNKDKYIGVIFVYKNISIFAPITHDGNKNWLNRDDKCDIEKIYNNGKYIGSLLLCKAIPINNISTHLLKFNKNKQKDDKYTYLCINELKFLNLPHIYNKVKNKLLMCINNEPSSVMKYRVDYELAWVNSIKYQKLIELEKENSKIKEKEVNKSR